MYIEYNPVLIYLCTLFVCLALLVKALRDMCENSDEEHLTDYQGARALIFIIDINFKP